MATVDPATQKVIDSSGYNDQTPLHLATENGRHDVADLLHSRGGGD